MRLQLGVSIDCLADPSQAPFIAKNFIHAGNYRCPSAEDVAKMWKKTFRGRVSYFLHRATGGKRIRALHFDFLRSIERVLPKTNFIGFFYRRDCFLPFKDASFSFIFSEHFFEHLFLDEAGGLLKECFRCMKRGGVIRTVVPDADLRTYEPIEPAGFSADGPSWNDPQKHKMRWNVYALAYMLESAGFRAVSREYCDRDGNYVSAASTHDPALYENCLERELLEDFSYCKRLPGSLCVDGVKE